MATNSISDFQDYKTIFVNGLPTTVNDSELYRLVMDATDSNSVQSVHINRDQSRYETSIAYINMSTHEAAKTVISKLNGNIIKGKKINMSWAMKDYKMRTQNEANLFVKGIRRDVKQSQFQEVFEKYGEILSAKLSTNEKNESNGFGYVKFINVEHAEKAVAEQQALKQQIGEETFSVVKYEKQPSAALTNLYIGNIDKNITEDQFVKYFETFGSIRQSSDGKKLYAYAYVEKYGKNRGFINYENSEDANKALTSPKENVLGEGELVVAYYKSKLERKREWQQKASEIRANFTNKYKDFNLYVNTKKAVVTEQEIREQLEGCGQIYSLKVKYYSHEPTGVAYVCFVDAESTQKATEKCKAIGWECNKLITKTERNAQNYQYAPMPPYFYPYNYFQYLALFPQMFFNHKYQQRPNQGQKNQQNGKGRKGADKKKEQKQQAQQQQVQQKKEEKPQVTAIEPAQTAEDLKNELGDKLYDFILGMSYSEDLTGRITGVLLESIEYAELKKKLDENQEELKGIIEEVKTTLEGMEQ